jgi:tRNA pseudouridine38-40 synthase
MRTLCLTMQYAGTAYAGWQRQRGARTVQGEVEAALARLTGEEGLAIHGAGRTDAGVHAREQAAHFVTASALPADRIRAALNHFLPWDIRVMDVREMPPGFHARRSALSKEYRYRIWRGETMPPFLHPYALLMRRPLDLAAVREGAGLLVGTHDFAALRSTGSSAETSVRTITSSEWLEDGAELVYAVEADGFLYRMVRCIVGTLLEVGRGRRSPGAVAAMLAAPDRSLAGPVVPARGLHLWRIVYPE